MTKPVDDIFPKDEIQPELAEVLNDFSKGIDEVVNFGTHIISWDVKEAIGNDENIPVAMMLRHILELNDSISILIKNSSIDPCKPLLRCVLETFFGLEYLLENDTKNRALGFLVWHFHHQIKSSKKLLPTEQAHIQLLRKLQSDISIPNGIKPPVIPGIDKHIQYLETQLTLPLFSNIEAEYQNLINSGNSNPKWYQLFNGPKSIEQLANHLNRQALYEILYRAWSGPTHGTDIILSKLRQDSPGQSEIVQIRFPKDAQVVTQYAFILSLLTYGIIINKRIPKHKDNFDQWYLTIKKYFNDLISVQYLNVT